jgi:putative transposase
LEWTTFDASQDRLALASGAARLVGALMLEQSYEWAVTRRYMSMETVAQICDDHTIDVARIAAL